MNKLVRLLQNYLLIGLPLVVIGILWSLNGVVLKDGWLKTLQVMLSLNIMLWFATGLLFLVMLVTVPLAREKTLKRLANVQERDEREQYITGRAARATYISTLSLTLFLFFLSFFSLSLRHLPANEVTPNGHQWQMSVSAGLHWVDNPVEVVTEKSAGTTYSTGSVTPSRTLMLLILLVWQLVSFNRAARKEQ